MMTESPSDQETGQIACELIAVNLTIAQARKSEIVTLDRVLATDRESICVFSHSPACSGIGPTQNVTGLLPVTDFGAIWRLSEGISVLFSWLPPRDSNPDMLIQSQLSYH